MLFSTTVSSDKCKSIDGTINMVVMVSSIVLNSDGLYVNYEMFLAGSGKVKIKEGQKFIANTEPTYAALAKPIGGFEAAFKMIAPGMVEEAM